MNAQRSSSNARPGSKYQPLTREQRHAIRREEVWWKKQPDPPEVNQLETVYVEGLSDLAELTNRALHPEWYE